MHLSPTPNPVCSRGHARSTRRSLLISCGTVWLLWLVCMSLRDAWGLFAEGWFMSVTMVFGSFVAGATAAGGGSVAFPVMTLGFDIPPATARDFALMIQSVGMTSAAFTILYTRIPVVRPALVWASLGGVVGVVGGLELLAPYLAPAYAKMLFATTWLAFAFALFWINRYRERETLTEIAGFGRRHALLLFSAGVVGGSISSITGSGIDITLFALLVLRLGLCEKLATPTCVVLMALNSLVGFLWKGAVRGDIAPAAWSFWWVCVPVVVLGAPFGARFIKHRSRSFVACLLYVAIAAQFVASLVLVPQSPPLIAFSALVFLSGTLIFHGMTKKGVRRLEWLAERGRATPVEISRRDAA